MVPDTLIWGYSHQFVGIVILTVCMVKHHSYIPGSFSSAFSPTVSSLIFQSTSKFAMTLNMRSPVVRSKCDAKVERLVPPLCTKTRPAWWKQSGSSPRKFSAHGFSTFSFSLEVYILTRMNPPNIYPTWLWFWLKNQFSEMSTVLPITDHTTMMLLAAERSSNSSTPSTPSTLPTDAAQSSSRSSPKELYLVTVLWAPQQPKILKSERT